MTKGGCRRRGSGRRRLERQRWSRWSWRSWRTSRRAEAEALDPARGPPNVTSSGKLAASVRLAEVTERNRVLADDSTLEEADGRPRAGGRAREGEGRHVQTRAVPSRRRRLAQRQPQRPRRRRYGSQRQRLPPSRRANEECRRSSEALARAAAAGRSHHRRGDGLARRCRGAVPPPQRQSCTREVHAAVAAELEAVRAAAEEAAQGSAGGDASEAEAAQRAQEAARLRALLRAKYDETVNELDEEGRRARLLQAAAAQGRGRRGARPGDAAVA